MLSPVVVLMRIIGYIGESTGQNGLNPAGEEIIQRKVGFIQAVLHKKGDTSPAAQISPGIVRRMAIEALLFLRTDVLEGYNRAIGAGVCGIGVPEAFTISLWKGNTKKFCLNQW